MLGAGIVVAPKTASIVRSSSASIRIVRRQIACSRSSGVSVATSLIPRSPRPAATEVRFSSPPPATNSNRSPSPLSTSTHAAVISYQPSPGLPASQVTRFIAGLLRRR
jgi:hypothetical protein